MARTVRSDEKRYQLLEQAVANELFIRHGQLLDGQNVDGLDVGFEIIEMETGGTWRSRRTGKFQIRIGPRYGTKHGYRSVGFKQKADGSFNFDKIADKLNEYHDIFTRIGLYQLDVQTQTQINEKVEKQLKTELNLSRWESTFGVDFKTGNLTLSFDRLTADQARQMLVKAIELGLIKPAVAN